MKVLGVLLLSLVTALGALALIAGRLLFFGLGLIFRGVRGLARRKA